ncbi:MAG: hypothetical protein ACP5XB_24505 [Isosphaeraceae bacterium]
MPTDRHRRDRQEGNCLNFSARIAGWPLRTVSGECQHTGAARVSLGNDVVFTIFAVSRSRSISPVLSGRRSREFPIDPRKNDKKSDRPAQLFHSSQREWAKLTIDCEKLAKLVLPASLSPGCQ